MLIVVHNCCCYCYFYDVFVVVVVVFAAAYDTFVLGAQFYR